MRQETVLLFYKQIIQASTGDFHAIQGQSPVTLNLETISTEFIQATVTNVREVLMPVKTCSSAFELDEACFFCHVMECEVSSSISCNAHQ